MFLSLVFIFLMSNSFSILAQLYKFFFIFSAFGVIILVKAFKLHKQNDIVGFDHTLEHYTKLSFIAAEEVQDRNERGIEVL